MIRKVMIEVDENDLDDFIERGIVRADAARNATLIYESDDCINRQSVHDYISKNEYGAWVELPESTMHKDIDKLPSVIPKNKWTKISELPQKADFYHVVMKSKDPLYEYRYETGYFDIHVKCWYIGNHTYSQNMVIAWMPIPKYEVESEVKR